MSSLSTFYGKKRLKTPIFVAENAAKRCFGRCQTTKVPRNNKGGPREFPPSGLHPLANRKNRQKIFALEVLFM